MKMWNKLRGAPVSPLHKKLAESPCASFVASGSVDGEAPPLHVRKGAI